MELTHMGDVHVVFFILQKDAKQFLFVSRAYFYSVLDYSDLFSSTWVGKNNTINLNDLI